MAQNALEMLFRRQRSPQKHPLLIARQFWTIKNFCTKKFKNAYKWPKMSIFDPQRGQKFQILILSNMVKNCMKIVFRNKKSPQNPFFMILEQKKIFEKKKCNFRPKKAKKRDFQKFLWPIFWSETEKLGRFVAGRSVLSSKWPKICFITNRQKFAILSQKN